MNTSLQQASGWRAELDLRFTARPGRTVLSGRRRLGPLAVQRPFYPEGAPCHVYLLHPPGGVVGGDTLDINVHCEAGAHALITTPGATKFYRSAGPRAFQRQHLRLAGNATLEWLPQENILFPGARLDLRTHIELGAGARLLAWEINCLGRPVIDERFDHGDALFGLDISREGVPLLRERLRVRADNADDISGLRGAAVNATLLASGADQTLCDALQAHCSALKDACAGVTLCGDILVLRYLGQDTADCHRLFRGARDLLRPRTLDTAPDAPRIWAT
ncbi:urease accessory protein UreD [Granulosicoccaceae sp. 1_MG-2023]|nr:urease accessory protein UreD [Granulosicoccaceae sp. 1_MG-2023]